jgi:hypothetical protein
VKDLAKPAKCGLCRFCGAVTRLVAGAVSPQDCQRGRATVGLCRALRLFVVADRPELHAYEIQLNWTENGPLMWNGLQPGGSSMDAGPRQRPWGKYRRRATSMQLPSIDILSPCRAFFLRKMAIDGQRFVRPGEFGCQTVCQCSLERCRAGVASVPANVLCLPKMSIDGHST